MAFCYDSTQARLIVATGVLDPGLPLPSASSTDSEIIGLLVCVVNRDEKLESILYGFLELGVTGATVLHSEGMSLVVGGTGFRWLQNLM